MGSQPRGFGGILKTQNVLALSEAEKLSSRLGLNELQLVTSEPNFFQVPTYFRFQNGLGQTMI